jgi:predicted deacylase
MEAEDIATMTDPIGNLNLGLADPLPEHGRHSGVVRIPHSTDKSAYGFVPLPIAIVAGRPGPTVLLIAALYGDEHDAQIALTHLINQFDQEKMNGRVIAIPMANAPAAIAGTRNSPIDGLNLNKSFPGDVLGSPTSIIASYIERQLMTVSDLVIDLHSDSRSFRYTPSATVIYHEDPEIRARRYAAALAFGAPTTLVFNSFEDRGTSGAARRAGAVRIATEMGGAAPIAMTIEGVTRVLKWAGLLDAGPAASGSSRVQIVQQDRDFVYTVDSGMFEPAVELGQDVVAGQLAGRMIDVARPFAHPIEIRFPSPGTVVCTRGAGRAEAGDCLLHLATPATSEITREFEAAAQLEWLSTQAGRRVRGSGRKRRGSDR